MLILFSRNTVGKDWSIISTVAESEREDTRLRKCCGQRLILERISGSKKRISGEYSAQELDFLEGLKERLRKERAGA